MRSATGILAAAAALTVIVASASTAAADWLDINLNDNSLFMDYSYMPMEHSNLHTNFSYLYHSDDGKDDVHMGVLGLFVAERFHEHTSTALGGRLYGFDAAGEKAMVLAIGGTVRQNFHFAPLMGVEASGHIAPKVTSFGKAERFFEGGIRIFYEVLVNADVYLGYRNVQVKYENTSSETVEDSLHFGLRIRF
ncbi:YfaZ family outer membrane protein [Desulfurispira natronophila]|uniref:Outer membrane protein beta-barrel domain-containing protein n=1 Tax=Desulfurispira natronophila TaxID=682562 RepID=A0A7W7Y4T3_9BACT|nr:YfaZ family outer membrane protein [Desulfurispira natronophila]MBB5022101.1 hypothetical protein [Desulfurispira natronophila]